ncbi:MAG: glycosyltransferase family 4 protein [Chloroflexota bacterium]
MRILMLSQFYSPVVGGEERHVQDLSVELVARGHQVAVATLWHDGQPAFEVDQGVRVHRIRGLSQRLRGLFSESGRRHAPPFPDPGLMWSLRQVVAKEQPEIVHAHNWLVHSFLPLKAASGAKLVVSIHDYSLVCAVKTLMYGDGECGGPGLGCLRHSSAHYGLLKGVPVALANWAMGAVERRAVDVFLSVSQAAAVGNRLVGGRAPYKVIPNFLSADEAAQGQSWAPYLAQLPERPFLLYVGDLRPEKGIAVLLRAYAQLREQRGANLPPLVMIGRILPETPQDLPPNVFALGAWPPGAVAAARQRSLAALMPSTLVEPFGIAALEGLGSGRPVIASRIGGLADIVADGETGLLVPPGDADALRQAIERLIDDPELVERMGAAAKRRAAEFEASRIVPRIEQVYEELLKRHDRLATYGAHK